MQRWLNLVPFYSDPNYYQLLPIIDSEQFVNVGVGEDVSIKELAEIVKNTVGFAGELKFDSSKPDGTPRKLLDVTKLNEAGWRAKINLVEGVNSTYQWFLDNEDNYRQ